MDHFRPLHLRWFQQLKSFAGLAVLTFATSITWSQSVVLHLKNGDRISGSILSESATEISIQNPAAGKISIPIPEISRREIPPPPAATLPPPTLPPAAGALSSPAQTPPKPKPVETKPASPPKPEKSQLVKFFDDWNGEFRVGMHLGFSTRNRQTYTGALKATHVHQSIKNIVDYNASYGRTEGIVSDNQMDGSWKIEHDLGSAKRFHLYNAAGVGYDEIQKVDLRYDVGPGIGYKWLSRSNLVLKTEFGGNYQKQNFADDTEKIRYALRLAEDLTWQLSNKLKLDEKIEFFPKVDDFGDYRIRFESNLSYLLRNNLTVNLTVIDIYDTATPAGASHNDLQIRSTIGLKF